MSTLTDELRDAIDQAARTEKHLRTAAPTDASRLWRLQRNALYIFARRILAHDPTDDYESKLRGVIENLRDTAEQLTNLSMALEELVSSDDVKVWKDLGDFVENDYVTEGFNTETEEANPEYDASDAAAEIVEALAVFTRDVTGEASDE